MSDKFLQDIQTLQFFDRESANQKLKVFFNEETPFEVEIVSVKPSAISLNSINGFLQTKDGKKFFFKTHVEPQSIVNEYYNSNILAEAGYPIIKPIFNSNEWGKQFLIYDYFETPSLFDIVRNLEQNQETDSELIISIQRQADTQLCSIYKKTLENISANQNSEAPIHQLFYHRIIGGRFNSFYQNSEILLPGKSLTYEYLSNMKWVINGIEFQHTLDDLVNAATEILNPNFTTPSIIGHGDAHNGNIFLDRNRETLLYFDPAFAGRHSPLLDLAKPIFHNVFAIWMYFPEEIAQKLSINFSIQDKKLVVDHDFIPSTIRLNILRSKLNGVLKPILKELQKQGYSIERWQEFLKLALFCCSFLTMNLSDSKRFSSKISLLGLAMSIEMGSYGINGTKSSLDRELNAINEEIKLI